jgi:DNA-directed RNA polymerase specialized sigma subunit
MNKMTYAEELLKLEKRNKKIFELRKKGKTFQFIADKFGISRQRVYGILSQKTRLSTRLCNKGLDRIENEAYT